MRDKSRARIVDDTVLREWIIGGLELRPETEHSVKLVLKSEDISAVMSQLEHTNDPSIDEVLLT